VPPSALEFAAPGSAVPLSSGFAIVGAPLEGQFLSKAHHSVSPVIYFFVQLLVVILLSGFGLILRYRSNSVRNFD
jgi:glucose uptake protein GlcU